MLKKFESSLQSGGEIIIVFAEDKQSFLLDSPEGRSFAIDLLNEIRARHPSVIKAAEQKLRLLNKTLYSLMLKDNILYNKNISKVILSCCFGENDERLDWDGEKFNFEFPRMCRDATYCAWNGYAERNKDNFNVICGARDEFGFTVQERKVVLLLQKGVTDLSTVADIMCLTKASIWKFLTSIYKKTDTKALPELVYKISGLKI